MKDRRITWDTFSALVKCFPSSDAPCPLYVECAYGWPMEQERTATRCKIWRRLDTVEAKKCVTANYDSPCPKCVKSTGNKDCGGWVCLGECRKFEAKDCEDCTKLQTASGLASSRCPKCFDRLIGEFRKFEGNFNNA